MVTTSKVHYETVEPTFTSVTKPMMKHHVGRASKKLFEIITRFLTTLTMCYPIHRNTDCSFYTQLEDLPNEVVLKIISHCDFSSKMNMRAVNLRFFSLVDGCAHFLTRRNLVGGVEIRHGNSVEDHDQHDLPTSSSSDYHLTLRRPLKRLEILLPATRLANIMRHVCVCHSLKLRGVSLDESLASDILDASFRAISDVIIDRVHSVTSDTLNKLVEKAYPSNSLHIYNHSSVEATEAIMPDILASCPARDIAIESSITLIHPSFDDAALVRLVLSDEVIRRAVRLPLCAITHRGINDAAKAFYARCCELIGEMTDEMHCPLWEISVSLPRSVSIDRSMIEIPCEMREQCAIWGHLPPHKESFTVEVRVERMNLRIMVNAR